MNMPTGAPEPSSNVVHLQDPEPRSDGTYNAVTIFDKGRHGVLVWAGYVQRGRNGGNDGMHPGFVITERVSFMFWDDVWRYFQDREFSKLIAKLPSTRTSGSPARSSPG